MKKAYARGVIMPLMAILLMGLNLLRIPDSSYIRAIDMITLLTMGAGIAVLAMNLKTIYINNKRSKVQ
ncbi:MAG: hypothetical protein ABIP30_00730 [Ferruginibacter sp.]